MTPLLNTLFKLAAAGASLVAIAALILFASPHPEDAGVQSAQADLIDVFSRDARSPSAFSDLMIDEGLRPRPFDYNGNVVYFATKRSHVGLEQGLEHWQRLFVERGINARVHERGFTELDTSEQAAPQVELKRRAALAGEYLSGEIMPTYRSERFISMAGLVPKKRGLKVTPETLHEKWAANAKGQIDPMDHTEGFRYIDMTLEDDGTTTTTAVWADKQFDAHKIMPDYAGLDVSVDRDVPACIGCSRTFRLEGLDKNNDPFITNQYDSSERPEELHQFYHHALTRRGWTPSASEAPLDKLSQSVPSLAELPSEVMRFERDGEYLNVFLSEGEEGTQVTTLQEERALDRHEP